MSLDDRVLSESERLQGYARGLQAQLATALQAEAWSACQVPKRVQAFIDSLMSPEPPAPQRAAQRQGSLHRDLLPSSPVAASAPLPDTALTPSSTAARNTALAHAAGGSYYIVNGIALLLQQLEALLAFGGLPCGLHLNVGRPIAELLQAANAQCQRQVLGAGAMASAGLRSITARHMAVCSQCLLLLETLLPRLRHRALLGVPAAGVAPLASMLDAVSEVRSARARTPLYRVAPAHRGRGTSSWRGQCCLTEHFASGSRGMQAIVMHRQQIHSKLVTIMRERLAKALKSFHSVSSTWAAQEGEPPSTPDAATALAPVLQQLSKQLATLAAVLRPVMSQSQLTDIFLRIRRMYGDSIARCASLWAVQLVSHTCSDPAKRMCVHVSVHWCGRGWGPAW